MIESQDALACSLLSIKAEMAIAQNCLQHAATAAGHDRLTEAMRLLANAKRAFHSVIDKISKLPPQYDARSHAAMARIIEGEINQLEQHILKNLAP